MSAKQDDDRSSGPTACPRDRSRLALAWYATARRAIRFGFSLTGGLRATGRENIPAIGGALLVSNHLSHLDVFVLGVGSPRPLNYVARSSLFKPLLGPLIRSVGGFPIDREGSGTAGLKETIRRLKAGSLVLIFPEGTRSLDGELGPLKPGFVALVRARVPIIPAAVAGTFEALPPGSRFPRPHPLRVHFGPPIPQEELRALSPEMLTKLVDARIRDCQRIARGTGSSERP